MAWYSQIHNAYFGHGHCLLCWTDIDVVANFVDPAFVVVVVSVSRPWMLVMLVSYAFHTINPSLVPAGVFIDWFANDIAQYSYRMRLFYGSVCVFFCENDHHQQYSYAPSLELNRQPVPPAPAQPNQRNENPLTSIWFVFMLHNSRYQLRFQWQRQDASPCDASP